MAVGMKVRKADGTWTSGGGGGGPWETVLEKSTNTTHNWLTAVVRVPEGAVDTTGWTIFNGMFRYCTHLLESPWFDTSAGTSFTFMFDGCSSLLEVPDLDFSWPGGTSWSVFNSIFRNCPALTRIRAFGFQHWLSVEGTAMQAPELNELMTNLGEGYAAPNFTITGTPGAAGCDRSIATAKGWTVVG